MNDRSIAISILQQARDALHARLTERIIDSSDEIVSDAEGGSYLSEIETIYEQLGGRLAHLNAMLSNLPPQESTAEADVTASEIIYADLASAYPTRIALDDAPPAPLLGLPAPARVEEPAHRAVAIALQAIVAQVRASDLTQAGRAISELFDIRPSQGRHGAQAFARALVGFPDLARRIEELGATLEVVNDYAAAALLGECFEFQAIEALALVRALKARPADADAVH